LITGLLGLALMATLRLATVETSPPTFGDYNSYACGDRNLAGRYFEILTLTPIGVEPLADHLCARLDRWPGMNGVRISWHPRVFLTSQAIVAETYDLFFNREHLVRGMVPKLDDYYVPLLETPNYELHWVTLGEPPQPTAAYFADKVVGLLDDPGSQTFFLQPSAWLRESNIDLAEDQKRFYPDIPALFDAFARREVDLISSSLTFIEDQDLGPVRGLLITDELDAGTWFLNRRWKDLDANCELVAALRQYTPFAEGFGMSGSYRSNLACP
jgi:hypothetical protein